MMTTANVSMPDAIRVDIGGRALAAHIGGAGRVCVVFEGGLGIESAAWAAVAVAVSAHARVLVYDRANRGASDPARCRACCPFSTGTPSSWPSASALPSAARSAGARFSRARTISTPTFRRATRSASTSCPSSTTATLEHRAARGRRHDHRCTLSARTWRRTLANPCTKNFAGPDRAGPESGRHAAAGDRFRSQTCARRRRLWRT